MQKKYEVLFLNYINMFHTTNEYPMSKKLVEVFTFPPVERSSPEGIYFYCMHEGIK